MSCAAGQALTAHSSQRTNVASGPMVRLSAAAARTKTRSPDARASSRTAADAPTPRSTKRERMPEAALAGAIQFDRMRSR
eukprot:7365868-Prymnesium_polylepis.2